MKTTFAAVLAAALICAGTGAAARTAGNCAAPGVDGKASVALSTVSVPPDHRCATHLVNGYPEPDPSCTPGAVNPTVTLQVLQGGEFRTGPCVRDHASTAQAKADTYAWYGIAHPANNRGQTQTCELDHLVSLEIGGADTLDNIWPQCGPDGVTLEERYFKIKDQVENYLAAQVRSGGISLSDAQRGIATDWTQYLDAARAWCAANSCGGGD